MRLTRLTDYAVTLAVEMARQPERCRTAEELAGTVRLPAPTVSKILKAFRQAGLVEAIRGRSGGYRLSRATNACSLLDIMEALDGPFALTECGTHDEGCARQGFCGAKRPVQTVQRWLATHFDHLTLDDFLRPAPHVDALQARLHARWPGLPVASSSMANAQEAL